MSKKTALKALDATRVLQIYAAGGGYREVEEEMGGGPWDIDTQSKMNTGELLAWAVGQVMPRALIQQARNVELQRLQDMHKAVWDKAIGGDQAAIAVVIRLMERRAKLLGLDAPAKVLGLFDGLSADSGDALTRGKMDALMDEMKRDVHERIKGNVGTLH